MSAYRLSIPTIDSSLFEMHTQCVSLQLTEKVRTHIPLFPFPCAHLEEAAYNELNAISTQCTYAIARPRVAYMIGLWSALLPPPLSTAVMVEGECMQEKEEEGWKKPYLLSSQHTYTTLLTSIDNPAEPHMSVEAFSSNHAHTHTHPKIHRWVGR